MIKYLLADVETTGLLPTHHALYQLAGAVVIQEGNTFTVMESYAYNMRPYRGAEISPLSVRAASAKELGIEVPDDLVEEKALQVNNKTPEEVWSYPPPGEAFRDFKALLNRYVKQYDRSDKFWLVGYNVRFDDSFLRAWFDKQGDPFYGSFVRFPTLDVAVLAGLYLRERAPHMPNFRLASVADEMNISPAAGSYHDAQTDVAVTYEIFRKVFAAFTQQQQQEERE